MMKKQRRLERIEEEKPLSEKTIWGIPLEFILITIIMVSFFILILLFMGPCTESGIWFNGKLA